jgi:hypothetical protein
MTANFSKTSAVTSSDVFGVLHCQFRISGMSSPYLSMYCLCLQSCDTQPAARWIGLPVGQAQQYGCRLNKIPRISNTTDASAKPPSPTAPEKPDMATREGRVDNAAELGHADEAQGTNDRLSEPPASTAAVSLVQRIAGRCGSGA